MEAPERTSKSQRKRDMTALQDIGTELVMLNADRLAQLALPVLGHNTAELRVSLEALDTASQFFDDAHSLVRGVALRKPCLKSNE